MCIMSPINRLSTRFMHPCATRMESNAPIGTLYDIDYFCIYVCSIWNDALDTGVEFK